MAYLYPAMVAFTSNGNSVVKNAVFQVYAPGDTAFATPLAITDNQGNTLANLNSGSQGVFPAFQQAQYTTVVVSDTPNHQYAWTVPAALTGAVLQWGSNTYYAQGTAVVNPNGDLATANVAHTSGSSYNASNWSASGPAVPASAYGASPTASAAANTTAITNALNAAAATGGKATVLLAPGTFAINPISVPAGVELRGAPAISYTGTPALGTLLSQSTAATTTPVVTLGTGAALRSLAVSGAGNASTTQHAGIQCGSVNTIDTVNVFNCKTGIDGNYKSANKITNCFIHENYTDGIANTVDSVISGNYINLNGGQGVDLQSGANDNIIASNKLEWNNGTGILLYQAAANTVVGNIIDRNGTAGVTASSCSRFLITGNQLSRNGRLSQSTPDTDTHIRLQGNTSGIATGNTTAHGANDDNTGYDSPAHSVYLQSNQAVTVTANDLTGCTSTALNIATAGGEKVFGNVLNGLQSMAGTRANLGTTEISVPASGTATATFTGNALSQYSIGQPYQLTVLTRNGNTGGRQLLEMDFATYNESGTSAVLSGTATTTLGSAMVTAAVTVSADGSGLTVTLTNSLANAVTSQVSIRAY